MMKKILSMMLACVMVVGMVTGCGSSDEQKTSSSTSDSGKKKLTAAANVDYAPFEFYEDGKPVGFDVRSRYGDYRREKRIRSFHRPIFL